MGLVYLADHSVGLQFREGEIKLFPRPAVPSFRAVVGHFLVILLLFRLAAEQLEVVHAYVPVRVGLSLVVAGDGELEFADDADHGSFLEIFQDVRLFHCYVIEGRALLVSELFVAGNGEGDEFFLDALFCRRFEDGVFGQSTDDLDCLHKVFDLILWIIWFPVNADEVYHFNNFFLFLDNLLRCRLEFVEVVGQVF